MRPADRWLSIAMATLVIAATPQAWSREKATRHTQRRVDASTRTQYGAPPGQTLKEPFTAEEKRRFQEPTGHEVDRW